MKRTVKKRPRTHSREATTSSWKVPVEHCLGLNMAKQPKMNTKIFARSEEKVHLLLDKLAEAKKRSDEAFDLSEGVKRFKTDTQTKQIFVSQLINLWQRSKEKWREAETFWSKAVEQWKKDEHFCEQEAQWNESLAKVYEGITQKIT